jgi:hypothetical protein
MYSYVIRYRAEAFDDVPVAAFRAALSAELGTRVGALYDPLNHSPLYLPHTKRRYHAGDAYWRAIDPAQFETPVAEHAFANEAMVFSHPHLLADQDAMQAIVEACAKRYDLLAQGHQAVRLFHGEGEGFAGVDLDIFHRGICVDSTGGICQPALRAQSTGCINQVSFSIESHRAFA